jgi:hypothetical protein
VCLHAKGCEVTCDCEDRCVARTCCIPHDDLPFSLHSNNPEYLHDPLGDLNRRLTMSTTSLTRAHCKVAGLSAFENASDNLELSYMKLLACAYIAEA